jgi:hypothetical protein
MPWGRFSFSHRLLVPDTEGHKVRLTTLFLILLFAGETSFAQDNPGAAAARKWRLGHEHEIVRELSELLAIPNVASDSAKGAAALRGERADQTKNTRPTKNAIWCR